MEMFEVVGAAVAEVTEDEVVVTSARWCRVCGEVEGTQWFRPGRCDTKGGQA